MKLKNNLIRAKFLKRYKRFFSDFSYNNEIITAHVANTGTMHSCLIENAESILSVNNDPNRKLKYSFEMIHNGNSWIGVNTSMTNKLAIEGIQNATISELQGYKDLRPEVKIGNSRIDILLSNSESDQCYVEVKNVTLLNEFGNCTFPDAVTTRGQKHLTELMELRKKGIRTVLLFIVQREDCHFYQLQNSIDPKYCTLLNQAIQLGVELLVYQCKLNQEEIVVCKKLVVIS